MAKASGRHPFLYYLAGLIWIVALVLLDQKIKELVVAQLKGASAVSLVPGVLSLQYVENRGMAFGLLQDARIFFIVSTILVAALLLLAYHAIPENKRFRALSVGIVLILAGAIGNFIDRVRLGYVVDYFRLDFISFPVFNLADCYITWTAVIMAILLVFFYKNEDIQQIHL